MPDGNEGVAIKVLGSIGEVPAENWDQCSGVDDPFVSHAFLSALENSGSVAADAGWLPQHLAVEDNAGRIAACTPLYLKSHSLGEYVFDWNWAEAYERAGGRYYPKLQAAVPFTPVTGRRLLLHPDAPANMEEILAAGMVRLAERHRVSSLHITFPTEPQWRRLGDMGFLLRTGHQFHWENDGYRDFDDFLACLNARKRKAIRKERRTVADNGVTLRTLSGPALTEAHWDTFFAFYRDTSNRKWGRAYLERSFFSLIGERMGENVLLVLAERDGRTIAGALNFRGTETLYGRYWGCLEDIPCLHFEACYYQAIDYAIANGLKRVEAGAQGQHKVQRGYLPKPTYSAHWFADTGFSEAVGRYLEDERDAVEDEIKELASRSPFSRAG